VHGFSNFPHSRQFSGGFGRSVGDKIIRYGLLPIHSPDLNPGNSYLWHNFKDKVCRQKKS
jgi:hypothetical protein